MQKKSRSGLRGALIVTLALVLGGVSALNAAAADAPAKSAGKSAAKSAAKSAGKAAKATKAAKTSKASKAVPRPAKVAKKARKAAPGAQGKANRRVVRVREPLRPSSVGHLTGLQRADDPLDLKSSVALVIDQDTDEVLFSKNPEVVLPIASITKLMTALVVTEAGLSLDEPLQVTAADVGATSASGARSRLQLGTELSRGEMLHLALMSSENRAAHVLGRTYPGGMDAAVRAMNAKAKALGMADTRYVEPTGLSSDNRSSAHDLALLVRAASDHPIIRDLSTSQAAVVPVGRRQVQFSTTNGLVRNPDWDIGLQKTGYISAAGRCLVMQAQVAGRKLIMVLLDSAGKYSRMGDAERIRKWLATAPFVPSAMAAPLPGPAAGLAPVPARVSPPTLQLPVPPAAQAPVVVVPPLAAPLALPAPTLTGPRVAPLTLPGLSADQPR